MGLGKITQVGVRAAEHKMGDVVVVVGLGLLGQLVTQYTRLLGASEVIAIDTSAKRLEFASMHGATATLKMTAAEALDHVKKLSNGQGADVVYEITGHPAVFATAFLVAFVEDSCIAAIRPFLGPGQHSVGISIPELIQGIGQALFPTGKIYMVRHVGNRKPCLILALEIEHIFRAKPKKSQQHMSRSLSAQSVFKKDTEFQVAQTLRPRRQNDGGNKGIRIGAFNILRYSIGINSVI